MSEKIPVAAELPLWLQLNKVSKKYADALAAKLGHLGIRRHYFLLVAISESDGAMTQQDLADLLETDKVSMVGILDSLTQSGFVKRVPSKEDRRKHHITLTPKAELAVPKIKKAIAELNQRALSGISGLNGAIAAQFPAALQLMKAELENALMESRAANAVSTIEPVLKKTAKKKQAA